MRVVFSQRQLDVRRRRFVTLPRSKTSDTRDSNEKQHSCNGRDGLGEADRMSAKSANADMPGGVAGYLVFTQIPEV